MGVEGGEHDGLSRERVVRVRREYEAKFQAQEADVRGEVGDGDVAGSDDYGEDEGQQSEGFESQETTLVEGLEEFESLHPTLNHIVASL